MSQEQRMIKSYSEKIEKPRHKEKSLTDRLRYEQRYIRTYRRILGDKFRSRILDVGCGLGDFVRACREDGYQAEGIDIDRCNFESDSLPYADGTFNLVVCNALIEHIADPDNIINEIRRVLGEGGFLIIRTPNWQMDYKNFYNNPTHKRPYTPVGLKRLLEAYNFKVVFLEPGLIAKSGLYWKLPDSIKWRVASLLYKGTRSILAVAEK